MKNYNIKVFIFAFFFFGEPCTGCQIFIARSINMSYRVFINYCVFSKILRYILNAGFPRKCVCIELHAGPLDGRSIATELAELKKSQHFEEKTQFLLNSLYMYINN